MRMRIAWMVVAALAAGCGGGEDPPVIADASTAEAAEAEVLTSTVDLATPEASSAAPVDGGQWVPLPESPLSPRAEVTAIWTGSEALFVGGTLDPCPPTANCELGRLQTDGAAFDPVSLTWRTIAPAPAPFTYASTAVLGDDVYIWAYVIDAGSQSSMQQLLRYEIGADRWSLVPADMLDLSIGWGIVATDDRLVVYPGSDESGLGAIYTYDPSTAEWSEFGRLPEVLGPAFDRVMVWANGALYVFDKELVENPSSGSTPSLTRVARYDPASGNWVRLADSDMYYTGPFYVEGTRIINPYLGCADGGRNEFGRCVEFGGIFDTATEQWSPLPDAPGRGELYFVGAGGIGSNAGVVLGDGAPLFDAATGSWYDLPALSGDDVDDYRTFVAAGRIIIAFSGVGYTVDGGGDLLADSWMWSPPRAATQVDEDAPQVPPAADPSEFGLENPPSVTVLSDPPLELRPFTACWRDGNESGCVDGIAPEVLDAAGAYDTPIRFTFPLDGWTFVGGMTTDDWTSGGPTEVVQVAERQWEIQLIGDAGPATVQLQGRGPQGEVNVTFAVELLVDSGEPAPMVDFAAFYGDDGVVRTTWLGLVIVQLGDDRDPRATVTVTAANGGTGSVDLGPHPDGPDPEGNGVISLTSTQEQADQLLALGPAPYDFVLEVTIGGAVHRATFRYPDDLNPDTTSFQPIFEPALPARSGATPG